MKKLTVAIDGTAGSGKSTLGKALAEELGYFFLDTGLLYRAISRHALTRDIDIEDESAICMFAENLEVTIQQLQPTFKFALNQSTVNDLYKVQIDKIVPIVASYEVIRLKVREIQRQVAKEGNVILAGRDIGTVVLPDADLKFYIDVSLEERARRRFNAQNVANRSLEAIKEDIQLRDYQDKNRHVSPLKIASDAIVINTDGLDVEEAVAELKKYVSNI